MKCPMHPEQTLKQLRPDGFGCPICKREWLIHKLSRIYDPSIERIDSPSGRTYFIRKSIHQTEDQKNDKK